MIAACPSMFGRFGFDILRGFLHSMGVEKIHGYTHNEKWYFTCIIPK